MVTWRRTLVAVSAAVIAGHLGPISQPYQIGAVLETGRHDAAGAGLFMGVQIACYSLTLMGTARYMASLDLRQVAFAGALLSCLSFLLTGGLLDSGWVYVGGALIGVGQGLVFSTSIAAAARSTEPEKLLGMAGMIALVFFAAFMAITPVLQATWGTGVLFRELAGMTVIFAAGLIWLPTSRLHGIPARLTLRSRRTLLFLAMIALFGVATGGVYAFMERMGRAIGIPPEQNGLILMAGLLFGAAGSAAAGKLGIKFGRLLPLSVALVMIGVASFGLGAAPGILIFTASTVAYQVFYSFAYPYLIGTAAYLERSGSLASFVGGFIFLTSAAGAALAGAIVQHMSYAVLGGCALLACVLAACLCPRIVRDGNPEAGSSSSEVKSVHYQ